MAKTIKHITSDDFRKFAPRAKNIPAVVAALNSYLFAHRITNTKRLSAYLGNTAVETGGYRFWRENLNYSATRLRQVWPKRFNTDAKARKYARNPKALANYVYGGRMGNQGHTDWGWKNIGRGPMMTTGANNYAEVHKVTGLDVINHPELLEQIEPGTEAACMFFANNGCNELADQGKLKTMRRRINGGLHGYKDMLIHRRRALKIFAGWTPAKSLAKKGGSTIGAGGVAAAPVIGPDPWFIATVFLSFVLLGVVIYVRKQKHDREDKDALARLGDDNGFRPVEDLEVA